MAQPEPDMTHQYITDESGNKTAVILPISEYEEMLEDMRDLATLAERRDEPAILHDQVVKDLKKDGFL